MGVLHGMFTTLNILAQGGLHCFGVLLYSNFSLPPHPFEFFPLAWNLASDAAAFVQHRIAFDFLQDHSHSTHGIYFADIGLDESPLIHLDTSVMHSPYSGACSFTTSAIGILASQCLDSIRAFVLRLR